MKKKQKGLALLLTVAIMIAMMLLVLPQVTLNQNSAEHAQSTVEDEQAKWMMSSLQSISTFVSNRSGDDIGNRFIRTHTLPGWMDFPLKFKLADDLSKTDDEVEVLTILPFFTRMATARDDEGVLMKLKENKDFDDDIDINDIENSDGIYKASGKYFISIGGELILKGVAEERAYRGTKSTHRKDMPVYAITEDMMFGYLKINDEWMEITGYNAEENKFTGVRRGIAGTAKATHDGYDLSDENDTSGADGTATVEYYPVFPHLRTRTSEGYVSVEVVDENSKININSVSGQQIEALGNQYVDPPQDQDNDDDNDGDDNNSFINNVNTFKAVMRDEAGGYHEARWPFVLPQGMFQMAYFEDKSTGVVGSAHNFPLKELVLDSLTTFSEPDYSQIAKVYGPDFSSISSDLRFRAHPLMKKSGSNEVYWEDDNTALGKADRRIYPHPLNVNTASLNTLMINFVDMGHAQSDDATYDVSEITGHKDVFVDNNAAQNLASELIAYRSGEPRGKTPDYFDGDENPFDGVDTSSSNRNEWIYYNTPHEELMVQMIKHGWKADMEDFNSQSQKTILAHIYPDDILQSLSMRGFKSPFTFYTGRAKTATSRVVIKKGKGPAVTKTEKTVFKDIGSVSTGVYRLGGSNGWNETMATSFGTSVAPVTAYMTSGTIGNGSPTISLHARNDYIGGKLFGRVHNYADGDYFEVTSGRLLYMEPAGGGDWPVKPVAYYISGGSTGITAYGVNDKENVLMDFGLRLRVSEDFRSFRKKAEVDLGGGKFRTGTPLPDFLTTAGAKDTKLFVYHEATATTSDYDIISVSGDEIEVSGGGTWSYSSSGNGGDHLSIYPWQFKPKTSDTAIYDYKVDGDNILYEHQPFYETVLIREGATWGGTGSIDYFSKLNGSDLEIRFSPTQAGLDDSTVYKKVDVSNDLNENVTITTITSDVLYIRVIFDDITQAYASSLRSPQLFWLDIGYTLSGSFKNENSIVLHRQ